MQVHDQSKPASTAGAQPQFAPAGAAAAPATSDSRWGLTDAPLTGPITGGLSAGLLKTLTEKITAEYKAGLEKSPNLFFATIARDNGNTDTYYSTLTVLLGDRDTGTIAYYTLILEATRDALRPRTESVFGRSVEVVATASDTYDAFLQREIGDAVRGLYQSAQLVNIGALVVARTFNVDSDHDVKALAQQTSNATFAALLEAGPNYKGLNLAVAQNDATLRLSTSFVRQTIIDAVGLPIRSDIQLDFLSQANGNNVKSDNLRGRGDNFSRAHVYMDVRWAPAPQSTMGNPYQQQPSWKYAVEGVITHVEQNKIHTTAGFLLELALIPALNQGDAWANTWWHRDRAEHDVGRPGVDWTDIGKLNLEANVFNAPPNEVNYIETSAATFDHASYSDYVQRLFNPVPTYSIDVPRAGTMTYALDILREAARGDQGAIQHVILEADRLTSGHFSKLFVGDLAKEGLFVNSQNAQLLGYFTASNGQREDLRRIDYLAVANQFLQTQPNLVTLWSDSFNDTAKPLSQRLDDRRKVIETMVPSYVITDYAVRVTPTAGMLKALIDGCRAAGLVAQVQASTNSALRGHERASAAGVLQGARLGGQQPIFSAAPTGGNNPGVSSFSWV